MNGQETLQPEQSTGQLSARLASSSIPEFKGIGQGQRKIRVQVTVTKILTYSIILIFVMIYLFPLLYLLNVSLKTTLDFSDDPTSLTKTLQLSNYIDAWVKGNFTTYLVNTALYTVTSTILQVTFALLAAYPLARGYVRGASFFSSFFVISLFLPNGLIPQFQLMLALHLYNTQLGYILLSSAVGIGPFLIIGYLKTIPPELDEAAAMDGCGYFRCLFTIIGPLVKPVLVTVAILHSIGVWNDIIGPIIYLTDRNYYPITRGLFAFKGEFSSDWTLLAAGTMLAAAPLIIVFLIFQRYFIEGAVAGAVK
jgi:raffinose/stachyose/melibiose transport system permease protein